MGLDGPLGKWICCPRVPAMPSSKRNKRSSSPAWIGAAHGRWRVTDILWGVAGGIHSCSHRNLTDIFGTNGKPSSNRQQKKVPRSKFFNLTMRHANAHDLQKEHPSGPNSLPELFVRDEVRAGYADVPALGSTEPTRDGGNHMIGLGNPACEIYQKTCQLETDGIGGSAGGGEGITG